MTEKFKRYQREHSRLHDPEALHSSAELTPFYLGHLVLQEAVKKKRIHKGKKKKAQATKSQAAALFSRLDKWQSADVDVTNPELSDPFKHESLIDYLSWSKLVSARADAVPVEGDIDTASLADAEDAPDIIVMPLNFSGEVELFQERRFAVDAPGGRQVELVWRRAAADAAAQRVVMDHQRGDLFETRIGLEDGDYFFRYETDGWSRIDQRYAQRVLLLPDGVWACLKLSGHNRLVSLKNRGKSEEVVRLDSNVPWLAPAEGAFRLPAYKSVRAAVRVLPKKMSLGLNDGFLRAQAYRNDGELTAAMSDIELVGTAGGVVSMFKYEPREFGWIMQGMEHLRLDVEVTVHGQGSLNGMVMLRHSGEVADFRLDTAGEERRFRHTFDIDSANLPYRAKGALKITFVTDSYLANYKFAEAEVQYGLTYLMKSLPALAYGQVRKGATRTLRLDVKRSDGREIDLEASIPAHASRYLEAYRAGHSAFSFRFDTRELPPGTEISEEVSLVDRSSGLSDRIKVLAAVADHQASGSSLASNGWKRR